MTEIAINAADERKTKIIIHKRERSPTSSADPFLITRIT